MIKNTRQHYKHKFSLSKIHWKDIKIESEPEKYWWKNE